LASGVVSSTLQIGSAFGAVAISGALFGAIGGNAAPAGYAFGLQISLAINSLLTLICVGLSMLLVRHRQLVLYRATQAA
jgi:hypothetical protein